MLGSNLTEGQIFIFLCFFFFFSLFPFLHSFITLSTHPTKAVAIPKKHCSLLAAVS